MPRLLNPPLKILLADDHPIFRHGLRQILESDSRLQVVAEALNGQEAIAALAAQPIDIAILDVDMPIADGFAVVRAIRQHNWPALPVFLTMHKDDRFFQAALDLGTRGYVLKDSALMEILDCIQAVAAGQDYVSPQLTSLLIGRIRKAENKASPPSPLQLLTPTEREVLRQVSQYRTSKQIAAELGSSVRTVEHHRANIAEKLGIQGSHAILRVALELQDELNFRNPIKPGRGSDSSST